MVQENHPFVIIYFVTIYSVNCLQSVQVCRKRSIYQVIALNRSFCATINQKRVLHMRHIDRSQIKLFRRFLVEEEKALATIEKYVHDVTAFAEWLGERYIEKSNVLSYKAQLIENYAPASVNSILSSLNKFFSFCGWHELKVKNIRIQRKIFSSTETELTKDEYQRLLFAAKDNRRLYLLMQTICSTGICMSELKFVTLDAVKRGSVDVCFKGKCRTVFIPKQLCKILQKYSKERKIATGPVFITQSGRPLDRSNIWADMKKLCKAAGVSEKKVFPHNLRHLFASTYYSIQKDIVRLADILGHSSVNTTRIYTTESGEIHQKQIQGLGLLHRDVCMT